MHGLAILLAWIFEQPAVSIYTIQPGCALFSLFEIVHLETSRVFYAYKRIKTEEKTKVVFSIWGQEFIHFLATLAVLPRTILNNMTNCTRMI